MGIACGCSNNTKDREIFLDTARKNKLVEEYAQLPENLQKIVLIQSIFRGFIYRLKEEQKASWEKIPTLKYNSLNKFNINDIFEEYPLLSHIYIQSELILKPPYEYSNKREMYYGEWHIKTNQRHGRGIQQWLDGSRYIGYWLKDKASIKGKLYLSNGDIYDGEWLNDKANGHGKYNHSKGGYYEGEWKNDQRHGNGKETFADGSFYEGNYVYGKRQGIGKFKFAEGNEYEGDFFEDML
ncbi:MAG: hypothetical protein MJ252_11345, partial [archaeon]|nr:hypothetical protein [archaeon]